MSGHVPAIKYYFIVNFTLFEKYYTYSVYFFRKILSFRNSDSAKCDILLTPFCLK
jgi:hypothetical protein